MYCIFTYLDLQDMWNICPLVGFFVGEKVHILHTILEDPGIYLRTFG